MKAASETALKDYRINVRISKRDVEALKTKALEEGIPYQTLVTSILHKYVTGRIIEKTEKTSAWHQDQFITKAGGQRKGKRG